MEQAPPTAKTIVSFMKEFVVKNNDVPPISGKPTFTTCKPLLDAVDKNRITMKDDRDPIYGKLHTVTNTSQLVEDWHNKWCHLLIKEDRRHMLLQQHTGTT